MRRRKLLVVFEGETKWSARSWVVIRDKECSRASDNLEWCVGIRRSVLRVIFRVIKVRLFSWKRRKRRVKSGSRPRPGRVSVLPPKVVKERPESIPPPYKGFPTRWEWGDPAG